MDHEKILSRLLELQREIRATLVRSRKLAGLHEVSHVTAADTIYRIDAEVEPILDEFCTHWAKDTPLVLIAEGIEDNGVEGKKVFPVGAREENAAIRVIMDPIDGTRGIMYDKRAAWSLAGVAPNRGENTRLSHIQVAAMTELPTSKMEWSDVLWAVRGNGASGRRESISHPDQTAAVPLAPSRSDTINHGFASVSNFFPGTKVLASELMETIVRELIGKADVTRATVFDDQYISTGGQLYELIVGHDRFNADLRPLFYRLQGQPEGLSCHPYDLAAMLVAEEAGVVLTDGLGEKLDGPLDVTTGMHWCGYANRTLHGRIAPIVREFLTRP